MSPYARTYIDTLQPYVSVDNYTEHPLWRLNELNNIDKHRSLAVCAGASMRGGSWQVEAIALSDEERNFDYWPYQITTRTELKLDAVVFQWAGLAINPDKDARLQPNLPLEIVFGEAEPFPYIPISRLLHHLCDQVGGFVIPALAKYL